MPRKTAATRPARNTGRSGFNEAAARCRGKHTAPEPIISPAVEASMRPRPDAAENATARERHGRGSTGFNEAAARCRGKPTLRLAAGGRTGRFNEAAARCRGKL